METMPQIKLPFWECLRRSFFYAFVNFDAFVKIASVWFLILLYEIFAGFPSLCGLKESGCPGESFQNVSVVMVSLASVAVAVAFSRLVVLRENVRPFAFSFGRRELKYLAYSLLLFLLIIVPSVMVMGIVAGILERIGANLPGVSLALSVVPLIAGIVCARFFIMLPAVAVDDRELTMKRAFALTRGNANKIFWGQALMMLPVVITVTLLTMLYGALNLSGFLVDLIMAFLLLGLSFFDAALKASYFSHVYQYFVYFWHHSENQSL